MALTLAEANQMITAAIAEAERIEAKIAVAVCDAGGTVIAMHRMDGAIPVSAYVCGAKAAASAAFGQPSADIGDSHVIQAIVATLGGRMVAARGAVPIRRAGELVGAIGASGAKAVDDERCILAGMAAVGL